MTTPTDLDRGKRLWDAIFFSKAGDGRPFAVDSFNSWAARFGAGMFRLHEKGGSLLLTNGDVSFGKGDWDVFSRTFD